MREAVERLLRERTDQGFDTPTKSLAIQLANILASTTRAVPGAQEQATR